MENVDWSAWGAGLAIVAFNLPVLFTAASTLRTPDLGTKLGNVLKEKDSAGDATDATSYSRVTGAIGAVMLGSLFWVVSNICIVVAIRHPADLTPILSSSGKLFLVGAALFLPYAFNQLKSVLQ